MPLSTICAPEFKTPSQQTITRLFRSREHHREENRTLKHRLKEAAHAKQQLEEENRRLQDKLAQQANQLRRLAQKTTHLQSQQRLSVDPLLTNHNFGAKMISMCLELAKAVGFRAAESVLKIVTQWLDTEIKVPHWTTIRTWLCRCGVGLLDEALTRAEDWILMIDHSVQLAKENVLLILGIRQSELPQGRPLKRADLSVLAIVPGEARDKQSVALALDELSKKIGVPMCIVADGASELHQGVKAFQKQGEIVLIMDDIKHKAANILKHTIGKDETFQKFEKQVGKTTALIQQTELAHFLAPKKKSKCRFMSLRPLLRWQRMIEHHLEHPDLAQQQGVSKDRLELKLGWVKDFSKAAVCWRQCQAVVCCVLRFSNRFGVYRGATEDLKKYLAGVDKRDGLVQKIYKDLIDVYHKCEQRLLASPYADVKLIVSTEVLESTLGGFKRLQRQHTRGGFTSLLSALPTLMSKQTPATVARLLKKVSNQQWKQWVTDAKLNRSTHAKKCEAYRATKTKIKQNSI